jgi:DNA repair protein RadD
MVTVGSPGMVLGQYLRASPAEYAGALRGYPLNAELRPYQTDAMARLGDAWRNGFRAPVLVAPTGSGKTVIAAEIIRRCADHGWRVLFLAPRRELIDQAYGKLTATGLAVNVVMAEDLRRDPFARITLASVDTLYSRRTPSGEYQILDPALIVVDECHLFVTALRATLLGHWPKARLLGLTATPARKDGRALGLIFDKLLEVSTVAELTADGFLVPGRYFSLGDPDLSRVRITAGDYNQKDLADVMGGPQIVGDVVGTWLARAGNRRTVVFAVNIGHSAALANEYKAHGVAAEHIDANTPTDERTSIFERFRSGETQVLTNCTLASYGFDLPELDCVVLARPTKSLVLYLQMLGRGLRPSPGKTHCTILDHAGVVRRFGFADELRTWSLNGRVTDWRDNVQRTGRDTPRTSKLRDCPVCQAIFTGGQCPACDWFHKPKGVQIETLDGELIEIDGIRETERERLKFYLQLRGEFEKRGKKPGAAVYSYREKFREWPPQAWNEYPVMVPGPEVTRWVKSRLIAFAKGRRRAA